MTKPRSALWQFLRRRREMTGSRFIVLLWSDVYRGLQIGRLWLGWTNPVYKAKGW